MAEKMKQCSKCGEWKSLSEFCKKSASKVDGLRSECKNCLSRQNKIYYQTHKNELIERYKKYHQIHKTKIAKRKKRRYQTIKGYLCCIFNTLKQRCNNSKIHGYKNYGGRGIKCLFKNSQEFIAYVIDKLQVDPRGLQIDRIDNDGNYEKGNIRFVTAKENSNNKKRK